MCKNAVYVLQCKTQRVHNEAVMAAEYRSRLLLSLTLSHMLTGKLSERISTTLYALIELDSALPRTH